MRHLIEGLEFRQFLSGSVTSVADSVGLIEAAPVSQPLRAGRVRPPIVQIGDYTGMAKIKMKRGRLPPEHAALRITSFDGTNIQANFIDGYFTAHLGELLPLTGTVSKKGFTLRGGERLGYVITINAKAKGKSITGTITTSYPLAPQLPDLKGTFKLRR